jgi:hypothetical protein
MRSAISGGVQSSSALRCLCVRHLSSRYETRSPLHAGSKLEQAVALAQQAQHQRGRTPAAAAAASASGAGGAGGGPAPFPQLPMPLIMAQPVKPAKKRVGERMLCVLSLGGLAGGRIRILA